MKKEFFQNSMDLAEPTGGGSAPEQMLEGGGLSFKPAGGGISPN